MESLDITLVQTPLHWEDPEANRQFLGEKIQALPDGQDVIVLPEMFTTGFSMNCAHLAEEVNGPTFDWLAQHAERTGAAICGSFLVQEEGDLFNRLVWMNPEGSYEKYDKRHLFTMANEQDHFTAGEERMIVEYGGFKFCPLICYDLRFPVWARNGWDAASGADYDVLLYVANWPERRSSAWRQLLIARAIENQCYVVGVNRVGLDGNEIPYRGDSTLIDPMGEALVSFEANEENEKTHAIVQEELARVREKLPFLPDQDRFALR